MVVAVLFGSTVILCGGGICLGEAGVFMFAQIFLGGVGSKKGGAGSNYRCIVVYCFLRLQVALSF